MKIDWFIFWAQIVNFLILLFLLRKFLYKPVVRIMAKREEDIAKNIREAEAIKFEAEKEAESYRARNEDFEKNRIEMTREAQEEAENKKKVLLESARTDVQYQKRRWLESIEQEQEAFLQDLKKRTSRQVLEITRKVIGDLTDEELQAQVVKTFIRQLNSMNTEEKEEFIKALGQRNGEKKVIIHCAFTMSEDDRQKVVKVIRNITNMLVKPVCKTDSELVLGIEMRIGGWKFSWSVEQYLQDLEEEINRMIELEQQTGNPVPGIEK